MQVDHGFAQPLEELTGGLARYPVIPLFINSVAPPVVSFRRARQFGEAVGEFARGSASGCSSSVPAACPTTRRCRRSPPPPRGGRAPDRRPQPRRRRPRRPPAAHLDAAIRFAGGDSPLHPLNPNWDEAFLANLACQDWTALDGYGNAAITEAAGASAHEVKTWVAANAAMNAATGGTTRPVPALPGDPEWIAGFAALTGAATDA